MNSKCLQEVEDGGASRGGRQGRASMPSTVHPEVLVVVDDEFYKGMDRDVAATQGYVVSFLNAVNMRFATVRHSHPVLLTAFQNQFLTR